MFIFLGNQKDVTESAILEQWQLCGGSEEISVDAIKYFKQVLNSVKSKSELMRSFSTDGISKFDAMFNLFKEPSPHRSSILQCIRRFYNAYEKLIGEQISVEKCHSTILNKDEEHILEYIAGYIIFRLQKNTKSQSENDLLKSLCTHETPSESLISALQCDSYGKLTIPEKKLTQLLLTIEEKFRFYFSTSNIIENVMSHIEISNLTDVFDFGYDGDLVDKVFEKICRYYLKIRCYQKANNINKMYNIKKDQNISLRKSLKIC